MTPSDHVSANYRYIAAYNEVNARIAQRQHALSLYITLVIGLIAALVASKQLEGQNGLLVEWLVYGFPIASACLTLLNYKYERTLANLRHYLSELECLNNSDANLPGYNTQPKWAARANEARRFHDFACAVLVGGANTIALGAFYRIYPEHFQLGSLAIWVTSLVTLLSVVVLLLITQFSYKPKWYKSQQ